MCFRQIFKTVFLIDKCINDNDNNNDPYINKQKPIKEKKHQNA